MIIPLHHLPFPPKLSIPIYHFYMPHTLNLLHKNPYQLLYHIKPIPFNNPHQLPPNL
ncbi:helix-hairpin-helix domain-containing protein, partial [Staphylococcus epidermidis]|uniref:helix-hairpin-helix domain-containing protein n=1 Tax=Staphylococcus epidermidis TaxID=1282 RepID=UPI0037DA0FAE